MSGHLTAVAQKLLRRLLDKNRTHMFSQDAGPENSRIILEQIDPHNLVPGGVDTCIHDLVKYSGSHTIKIVGVTSDVNETLGRWIRIGFAGKTIEFLPVARMDRAATKGLYSKIPQSLRLTMGVLRYRASIGQGTFQTHRVELGFIVQKLLKSRLHIQFIHNDGKGLTGKNSDSFWKKLPSLYRYLEKVVLRRAGTVVLFNATDAERIKEIQPRTVVSTTWFDPELYSVMQQPSRGAGLSQQPLRVCWVGRLEEQKDPILAIEAFNALSKMAVDDFNVTMIGAGRLESAVLERVKEFGLTTRVLMTGALTRTEVAKQMRDHDVMLMSSHYEGSPRVMAEALACGLPVVATAGADTDKILLKNVNGYRVEDRSPRALAEALISCADASALNCAESVAHRAAPAAIKRLLDLQ